MVMRGRKLDCKVLKTELKDMLHINSANKNICTLVPSVPNMNSFQSPVIIRIMLIIIEAEGEKRSPLSGSRWKNTYYPQCKDVTLKRDVTKSLLLMNAAEN